MLKKLIKNTIVILIVILLIAIAIVFKPETVVKKIKYEDVLINLMETKSIGVYTKGVTVTKTETNEVKVYEPGIFNNITDYEEIHYFINLIKNCPQITHSFDSTLMIPSERLYMYDENNEELLWIEVNNYNHTIRIWKDKDSICLDNKYFTEINEFLKKYINYEF